MNGQPKIFSLLKTLQTKEWKGVRDYLQGQYPSGSIVTGVWEILEKNKKKVITGEMSRADIYKKLFKKKLPPEEAKNFDNYFSKLVKYIKDFLAITDFLENKLELEHQKAKICWSRGLVEESFKHIQKAERELAKQSNRDMWYFCKKLQLHHFRYFYDLQKNIKETPKELELLLNSFRAFIVSAGVKYNLEIEGRKLIKKNEPLPQKVKFEKTDFVDIDSEKKPLLNFYLQLSNLFSQPNDEKFDRLYYWLTQNSKLENNPDGLIAYHYLMIYANQQIKIGKKEYVQKTFSVFKSLIEQIDAQQLKAITKTLFLNGITLACHNKDFDWCEEFIESKARLLLEDEREAALQIGRAVLFFQKGQLEDAQRALMQVDRRVIFFSLKARVMSIKIFLLLNDYNGAEGVCNAFEDYLRKNRNVREINDAARLSYKLLIRYARKIAEPMASMSTILLELEKEPAFGYKNWIRKYLSEKN